MVLWIVLAVLAVVLIFAWLKREQDWSRPVVVVCAVAIVGLAAYRGIAGSRRGQVGAGVYISRLEQAAQLMGRGLQGHVQPGARIVVLGDCSSAVPSCWPMLRGPAEKGLPAGLEDASVTLAGYAGPAPGTAYNLSADLQAIGVELDAIVSFSGLPEDLSQMYIYDLVEPPKVAAYFPQADVDRSLIRGWLEEGLVQGIVLREDKDLKLYTESELP